MFPLNKTNKLKCKILVENIKKKLNNYILHSIFLRFKETTQSHKPQWLVRDREFHTIEISFLRCNLI